MPDNFITNPKTLKDLLDCPLARCEETLKTDSSFVAMTEAVNLIDAIPDLIEKGVTTTLNERLGKTQPAPAQATEKQPQGAEK